MYHINGIQQVGIGNNDVYNTFDWYKRNLDMSVEVFDEEATAALMLPYTGGKPRDRHAILALNLQGGGGVEIWQYKGRRAEAPKDKVVFGDHGIYAVQYKVRDIDIAYSDLSSQKPSRIFENEAGQKHFYIHDLLGNIINIVEYEHWFQETKNQGGICGAIICVSNLEQSLTFYKNVLGYHVEIGKSEGSSESYDYLLGENSQGDSFRSVVLTHRDEKSGAFSDLLGKTQIQLVERMDFRGKSIFRNRLWGDLGYIHICFDVGNMSALRDACFAAGHPFQVDSGDFDMGDAGGHFAYVEDPDGTLIEFVETHKVPIIKKLGWYLNLKKRTKQKPLPRWMIKAMGW